MFKIKVHTQSSNAPEDLIWFCDNQYCKGLVAEEDMRILKYSIPPLDDGRLLVIEIILCGLCFRKSHNAKKIMFTVIDSETGAALYKSQLARDSKRFRDLVRNRKGPLTVAPIKRLALPDTPPVDEEKPTNQALERAAKEYLNETRTT